MTSTVFTSLLVTGADARPYLQGQLTCDIESLTSEKSLLACVNSAQGRVQAVLDVSQHDEGIALTVLASMAERLAQRLRKYVLRSKVKIEVASEPLASAYGQEPDAPLLSHLRAGIPHVSPETHEAFVAQMLNLDLLGGISFEKGCYTGQEIIARAHFRGAVKRRMFRFSADSTSPTPGTRILSNGEHAGDVVYAAATDRGCELLAVISLAQAEQALTLDQSGVTLTKMTLPYAPQDRDSGLGTRD